MHIVSQSTAVTRSELGERSASLAREKMLVDGNKRRVYSSGECRVSRGEAKGVGWWLCGVVVMWGGGGQISDPISQIFFLYGRMRLYGPSPRSRVGVKHSDGEVKGERQKAKGEDRKKISASS